ncbi:MAG: hypothetical protein AAFR00_13645 [Pseudomonadota bacterium]
MTKPARFTQAEVERVIRAAQSKGLPVVAVSLIVEGEQVKIEAKTVANQSDEGWR